MTKASIDKRKKYIMVVDVETAGSLANPLIYDFGFAICDKKGNVYAKRSFVIQEIFDNQKLMQGAYFANKVPNYKYDIEEGKRLKVPFLQARQEFINLMKEYNVQTISAYNLAFDRRALTKTTQYLCGANKKFLPLMVGELEQLCIWSFACEVIYTQPTFWKVAEKQNWFSPKGNMLTSAEIGWRYISKDYHFEEEHTGLEDVLIEIQILAKCYAQRKKHESGILNHPWRIPNNTKKEKANISKNV